ncbi:MAG TPA: heme ABC transporter permease CcmC [Gammaproteobacteria bacterium]|jgi:heme exporter protein C
MKLPRWFHRFGSPPYVYNLADAIAPWLGWAALVGIAVGAYWGLFVAPPDFRQGEVYRIIYIHPQTAYVGMMAYTLMAVSAGIGFIWRIKLAHAVAVSAAPIGASFTFCALVTGAIWGRPTWGTYWEWGDPRLMFELLLLFLFLGYLALRAAFDDRDKADRVSAVLAVVGVVNVPIIHYSVEWWNTLHQDPTVSNLSEAPSMDTSMLLPFLIMVLGFTLLFYWLLLRRLQAEIIDRERGTRWLQSLANEGAG